MQQVSIDEVTQLPLLHETVVPESWLDDMLHMNVMWYTHLFSQAAVHLFASIGLDRSYFETNHRGTFALETHTRYYAEIRVGKHVSIRTRLLGRTDKRVHFIHFMTNDDDDVLATTGEYVSAHIDMHLRRMTPLPDDIADAYDRLLEKHRALDWEAPVCGTMRA